MGEEGGTEGRTDWMDGQIGKGGREGEMDEM